MKRCDRYLRVNQCLGAFAFLFLLIAWLGDYPGMSVFFALIQLLVGLMQLLAGIHMATSKKDYPAWLEKGMANYWLMTFGYFVLLLMISRTSGLNDIGFRIYLFGVPWTIALYQYSLISHWRDKKEMYAVS